MLISAIEDENPVVCLEHRWLYGVSDAVPKGDYRVSLSDQYYPLANQIVFKCATTLGIDIKFHPPQETTHSLDQPDDTFRGPF